MSLFNSPASRLDALSAAALFVCIIVLAVAIEMSAPIGVVIGAVGAAATGIARLAYAPKLDTPPRIPLHKKRAG